MDDSSNCGGLVQVTCPSHNQTLVHRLWHFFKTQHRLDFNVQFGGKSVLAHLLVVDAFLSPDKLGEGVGFGDMAVGGPANLGPCLDKLIEFMYCGTVSVPQDRLQDLLQVAKDLGFALLVEACTAAMDTRAGPTLRATRKSTSGASVFGSSNGSAGRVVSYAEPSTEEDEDEEGDSAADQLTGQCHGTSSPPSDADTTSPSSVPPRKRTKRRTAAGAAGGGKRARRTTAGRQLERRGGASDGASDGAKEKKSAVAATVGSRGRKGAGRRCKAVGAEPEDAVTKKWRQCKQCSFKTNSKQAFLVHRAKHDPSIVIAHCSVCGRNFVGVEAVPWHACRERYRHHCSRCSFKTYDKARLHLHLATHDSSAAAPVLRCRICKQPFLRKEVLDRHMAVRHAPPTAPLPTNRCSLCDYESTNRATYQHHLFATHGLDTHGAPLVKKLRCERCDFACVRPSELRHHTTVKHSTEKPYKCPQCPYACALRNDLHIHNNRIHLRIRNFPCDMCEQRFATNYAMERHRRARHTGERPFVCDVCGKAYGTSSTLKWHYQCHEPKMEHVCHVCGHIAKRLPYLKAHLKNVHKLAPPAAANTATRPRPTVLASNNPVSATPPPALPPPPLPVVAASAVTEWIELPTCSLHPASDDHQHFSDLV